LRGWRGNSASPGRWWPCEGGIPIELLSNAAGIVTINSTVGTTGLYNRVPVKVLGNAVFDIPGLTSQQPLDAFWQDPSPPTQS